MRLAKHRRKTRMEMDMTPMIDVAFQLIIFFMTVSQMTQADQEILQLPKQTGSEIQLPRNLVINVTSDGQYRVGGETLTVGAVISRATQELQEVQGDVSKLHVIIRADQRSASRGVNDIVTALTKMRVTRVRIAVETGA